MKLHKLYKAVDIIKETEKAVCVKNIEISTNMGKMAEISSALGQKVYTNKKPFWIPKSQIEIKDNKIVAITKWLYNQQIFYLDTPFCLQEDIDFVKDKYETKIKARIINQTKINERLKGEKI